VVGRRIRLNGEPCTLLGVMAPGVTWPGRADIWVLSPRVVPTPPLTVEGDLLAERGMHYFQAVGRLRSDATLSQAQAELRTIAERIARDFPGENTGRGVRVARLRDGIVGDVRPMLWLLLATVSFVLLIACANIASLLLARATERQHDVAVRAALGATRGRLVRQLLGESLVLGILGGIAGLGVAAGAVTLLSRVIPASVPRVADIRLDAPVVLWTLAVALLTGVIFGVLPALSGSRVDLAAELKAGGGRAATAGRTRLRGALVVAEIALTFVLLVAAGLLATSFSRLQRVDHGFRTERVTQVMLPIPQERYPETAQQALLYGRLIEGLAARPGIEAAAVVFPSPLEAGNASGHFNIEGRPRASGADRPFATVSAVSPDFFRTLGIPIRRGRAFTAQDTDRAPNVAIVNETLARRYWPDRDPLGVRLSFEDEATDDWITIVGVVGDTRNQGFGAPIPNILYLPHGQFSLPFMTVLARGAADLAAVATMLRAEVAAVDPLVPVPDPTTLEQEFADSVSEPRFRTILVLGFALVAALLAAVGVYGLVSYTVAQRTREVGIRVALGASGRQVMAPLLRHGLALAGIGLAIGVAGALLATRALSAFLFEVGTTDPLTFGTVAVVLLVVALAATWIPARRALRVDPMLVLRAE
jgi:putative ABC transport system permease protein